MLQPQPMAQRNKSKAWSQVSNNNNNNYSQVQQVYYDNRDDDDDDAAADAVAVAKVAAVEVGVAESSLESWVSVIRGKYKILTRQRQARRQQRGKQQGRQQRCVVPVVASVDAAAAAAAPCMSSRNCHIEWMID